MYNKDEMDCGEFLIKLFDNHNCCQNDEGQTSHIREKLEVGLVHAVFIG